MCNNYENLICKLICKALYLQFQGIPPKFLNGDMAWPIRGVACETTF